MRIWRSRRRQSEPPAPLVLPRLDRLSELVDRVVVLLDQAAAPVPGPVAGVDMEPVPPEPEPEAAPRPEPAGGHVLVVAEPSGYRLVERDSAAPARGDVLDVDGVLQRVLRVGPSPLPGDGRRCAFLGQEPPEETRSFDA